MLLWHMGIAAAIVYMTLGRRRIDYRFILIGAVVPDLIDGALAVAGVGTPAGRSIAHTILAVIVVWVGVILVTRGERRLAWFGLGVGWLLHLVGDGMWSAPRTFLWPAFGLQWSKTPPEPYSWDLFTAPWNHLGTWMGEVTGAAVLLWFWIAFELGRDGRFRAWLNDGHLRP